MDERIEVFIAFERKDLADLRELKNQLRPLESQGLITVWDASQILAGVDREKVIAERLNRASIILLLVNADFLASDEGEKLIKQALARHAPPKVRVVPVLLHPVRWEVSAIGSLSPLPANGQPISRWRNRHEAYVDVVMGIEKIVEEHKKALQARNMEMAPVEIEKEAIDSEQFVYRIEDQAWFAGDFPQTTILDTGEIDALKKEIDVLLITANDHELDAVMHLVEPYPGRKEILQAFVGPETYYLGKFGAYKAVVTKCHQGTFEVGAISSAAGYALNVWHPRAAVMVGVAFGQDSIRQKIADVLVASQIIPYDRMRIGEEHVFRGAIPSSNPTLLNRFKNAPSWRFLRPDGTRCALHIGPILSGEKLVDDLAFKRQLFQRFPQAIGGEMEGAGLWAVSGHFDVAWILVKSICDWGDGKKQKLHQPLAAAAAASLVHHVLSMKNTLDSLKGGTYP